jgi:para-nitrobenzyl esterase
VRAADVFGPSCAQVTPVGSTGEEDCLFLNIWAHNDDVVRPVFVYLHPGGRNNVSGAMLSIDGTSLADNGDVIVVNMNRRLGPLGFLAIDELVQENPRSTAGNYAVLDVIAALEWVQENIASFNGDPNRVMLSGTSAGGGIACYVLSAPEAAGLFHAAALMSPACAGNAVLDDRIPYPSRNPPALEAHRGFLDEAGCAAAADVPGCLRDLAVETVVDAGESWSIVQDYDMWGPVIDGVVIPTDKFDALSNEVVGSVPLIVGATANELDPQLSGLDIADDQAYRDLLAVMFEDPLDDQVYDLYPTVDFDSPKQAFITLMNDIVFSCPAGEIARHAAGGAPAYLFELSRGATSGAAAHHGADLMFLFDTFDLFGVVADAGAEDISVAMQQGWASLAADPTAPPTNLPMAASAWPAYDANADEYVDFGEIITTTTAYRDGRCPDLTALLAP